MSLALKGVILLDFLIKNGTLYDPEEGVLRQGTIALIDGVISAPVPGHKYRREIDANGCIVSPGLIDYHVHYFNHGTMAGVNPDLSSFPCGITTAVDAGSAGAFTYGNFHNSIMGTCDVRLLAELLVSGNGQISFWDPEDMNPEIFDEEAILKTFRQYPGELVGLKARLSKGIVDAERAREVLHRMVEIAEKVNTRIIIHVTNPVIPIEEMAKLLRPGDVICHIYQKCGDGDTCLDAQGRLREGLLEARDRGVLFDACNGRGNFDIEVAKAAVAQGFVPDIISSDTNGTSNFLQPLHSLPRILSKFMDFGMSLEQVLDTATIAPAKLIGMPQLGTLAVGTTADICIFKLKQKPVPYEDINGNHFTGNRVLVPQMTFKGGDCVFCQADFE